MDEPPAPRVAFGGHDDDEALLQMLGTSFGGGGRRESNSSRRDSSDSLFHQRWHRRSSAGLDLPSSEEWLSGISDSSDDEVVPAPAVVKGKKSSRRRSLDRNRAQPGVGRSPRSRHTNVPTPLSTHAETVSASSHENQASEVVAESDGEATPDYPGPSTVIGAIIAADSHRLHDGSDVEVGGTNSREKPDPARFLRDRSVSDVIQPEVLAHASQLSLPGQSEPEELPDEAEEAMGASGEGFSRRNSLTGSALQVQMQLENGLTRRHVQENLNSRESSRRGSRDSQTSAASGSSRRFKVRRRNRSRANSQNQGDSKPVASDKRPPTADTAAIPMARKIVGRGQLQGSFFGRHSSVSPSMTPEAWKEDEVEELEDGDAHDQSCGAGLQALKARLVSWCLTGTVYRPREETRFGRLWILLITVICAYNILIIPFRLGFRDVWHHSDWLGALYTLDYFGDLLLIIDIFLNFRTAFIHDGLEVKDSVEVASHYYHQGFTRDLISTLPIDLFFWSNPWAKVLARAPRLLRVGPMLKQLEELSRSTELGTFIQIVKLFSGVLILCHYLACFYFLVAYVDGFTPMDYDEGWAPFEQIRFANVAQQYFIGFTWSVDVVAGAFVGTAPPKTNLQRGLMIIADFSHVLVIAFFIGSVEALLSEWNRDAEEFRGRMLKLNQFMGRRRLNKELQQRVRNYYFHAWSRSGAFDNPSILRDLPVNLRTEVNVCTHGKLLAKVPLFKACDKAFLNQLTEKIKLRIYAPGDMAVTVGEEGDEMFILNRGDVDIETREGKVLVTLGEGSVIGEVAFFSPNSKRTASVRAKTWCDFACLEKQDFMTVASRFPEERMALESLAHARLAKDILRKHIGSHPLFEGCEKEFIGAVSDRFHPYEFMGGETLFVEGEPSDAWLFVGIGCLKVSEKVPGVTKKHDKTIVTELAPGSFLEVTTFIADGKRKSKCKASTATSILALDKTAFEQAMLEYSAFDIIQANASNIARKERLESAKTKFRRAMSRLRTSNLFGHLTHREPSIAGSDTDSIVSVAPMENFKGLADEVLDSKLQEALKLVTAITTARTQRLAHSHPN